MPAMDAQLLPVVANGCCYFSRALCSRRDTPLTILGSKSGLAFEKEVALPFCRGEDYLPSSKYELKHPPCITPVVSQTAQELNTKLISDSSVLRRKEMGKLKVNVHFVEETDEGMLSKRILSLSRSNKLRSALELYMSMEVAGLQPSAHACNSLLACLVRNGSLAEALEVFQLMRKRETTTGHTYSLILKAVAGAQGFDSALGMFKALEGEVAETKKFDAIVYNTMISICGKAKNWVETEILWRKLKHNSVTGTILTYDLLVSTFVQCGQTELALEAYHEMIENGLETGEDIMKAMIASCTKDGKWDIALGVFQKMLDSGFQPNAIVYNTMINSLGKAGKYDLAFKIYGLMKSSERPPDCYTWTALLNSLYRGGRYADALQLFEIIRKDRSDQLNVYIYNVALMSCQKFGLWERSLQLLWQMETSGLSMSTESYNHVIFACEASKEPKIAWQVYKHMIHKKCDPDEFTYQSLIRACVWGSLWTQVESILKSVGPNASLYNTLIHGLILRGKITLAKKWYERMCTIGLKPDGKTRALMLQHLSTGGISRHPRYKV